MWRQLSLLWTCVLAAGCWSSEPLVLDTFTPDQWEKLQHDLQVDAPTLGELCTFGNVKLDSITCGRAANLGQALFFERDLSIDHKISCASCHDPAHGWIDSRAQNNVSLGAWDRAAPNAMPNWSKRNAIAVTNAVYKERQGLDHPFGWIGGWKRDGQPVWLAHADDVVDLAFAKPMRTPPGAILTVIGDRPQYADAYQLAFKESVAGQTEPHVIANVKIAIEAYLLRLYSTGSRFDQFLAGDKTAMTESEQRGFVVFTTRGMCMECHAGRLLSDFAPHVTGVPQVGPNVVALGSGGEQGVFELTQDPMQLGSFVTPSLRDISKTGPYMHDGALATLGDVVRFYNDGGGSHDYLGDKDPRLVPLGLDGQDLRDLEAFLGSLDGELSNDMLAVDTHVPACPMHPEQEKCFGTCTDLDTDPQNCGACLHNCGGGTCEQGRCTNGAPWCPTGMSSCIAMDMCTDLQTDPLNCGYCTHNCGGHACVMGECQ